ncbi:MAG: ECF-type sigma factor [Blastocatellia bacterium]
MNQIRPQTVTQLLLDWRDGDQAALGQLLPMVYDELHRRATAYMSRERPGHTLQATALINEMYLRLAGEAGVDWKSRNDLFVVCANLMRQVLVDIARTKMAEKHGGALRRVSLVNAMEVSRDRSAAFLALDDALRTLETLNLRQSRVVTLRYYGGLSVEETAKALAVSPETVKKDWKLAKVWLLRELNRREPKEKDDDFRTI